jgi:hypothetical protein
MAGNGYCFKQCFDKQIKSPYCPKPYAYNEYADICEVRGSWRAAVATDVDQGQNWGRRRAST